MNLIKKATFLAIAWLVGLIFVLVFSEIALRIIYYESESSDTTYSETSNIIPVQVISELRLLIDFEHDYDIAPFYASDEKTVHYKRDQFGIRNSCGDPSNIDILTIGGSTTDQRQVNNESTYQAVIENLASDYLGKKICVANAGIDGHSTYGHIRSFEDWFPHIPNLKPKYVLLYIGINDTLFEVNTPGFDGQPITTKKRILKSLIRKTLLAQKTRPLFEYLKGERQKDEIAFAGRAVSLKYELEDYKVVNLNDATIIREEENALAFKGHLETLLEHIKKMGAQPICVTQPHVYVKRIDGQLRGIQTVIKVYGKIINGKLHSTKKPVIIYSGLDYDYSLQQLNKVMYEVCGEDKMIDIYSVEFPEGAFYDGVHTTDKGSEFLGKKMYEAMKQKGMLEIF